MDGDKAYGHVAKLVSFGPRPPGSAALRASGDYIVKELARLGLTAQEQTWTETVDRYGKATEFALRNIWVEIPGSDPQRGPILLLAAHYDTKLTEGHPNADHNFEFVGAIDGGGASGLLLELARVLQDHRQQGKGFVPNIWLAWFDGEECIEFEWKNEKSLLGSTHFAKTFDQDRSRFPAGLAARMKVMVLMDLIGDRNLKIDRDTRSNGKLLDIFAAAAEKMGERDKLYRYESPMYDDHIPFKNLGVSVIDLIDFRWRAPSDWTPTAEAWQQQGVTKPPDGTYHPWWHTPDDNLSQVAASSLAFVGNLVWHALPAIEAQYYAP